MPSFKQIGIVISMLGLLGVVFQQSISKQNESKVAENSGKNLQRRKLNDDQEDIWGDDIDDAFNLTGEGEFKNGFDEGYLNTAGNIEEQYEHISDYCDEGTMETDANGSGLRGTQCNYHEASMTRHKDAIDGYNAKIVAAEAQHNCCSGEAPEACQNDFGGCGATALTTTQDAVNEAVKEIGLAKIDLEKARALLQQEALELFCACETSKYNNDNSHTVSAKCMF